MPRFIGRKREEEDAQNVEEAKEEEIEEEMSEETETEPGYIGEFRDYITNAMQVLNDLRESLSVLATEGIYINDVVPEKMQDEAEDVQDELEDLDFDI